MFGHCNILKTPFRLRTYFLGIWHVPRDMACTYVNIWQNEERSFRRKRDELGCQSKYQDLLKSETLKTSKALPSEAR